VRDYESSKKVFNKPISRMGGYEEKIFLPVTGGWLPIIVG
jgi:hypothetical protein